jgi:hypothetical protein
MPRKPKTTPEKTATKKRTTKKPETKSFDYANLWHPTTVAKREAPGWQLRRPGPQVDRPGDVLPPALARDGGRHPTQPLARTCFEPGHGRPTTAKVHWPVGVQNPRMVPSGPRA